MYRVARTHRPQKHPDPDGCVGIGCGNGGAVRPRFAWMQAERKGCSDLSKPALGEDSSLMTLLATGNGIIATKRARACVPITSVRVLAALVHIPGR
jgi:hypothetical protein